MTILDRSVYCYMYEKDEVIDAYVMFQKKKKKKIDAYVHGLKLTWVGNSERSYKKGS